MPSYWCSACRFVFSAVPRARSRTCTLSVHTGSSGETPLSKHILNRFAETNSTLHSCHFCPPALACSQPLPRERTAERSPTARSLARCQERGFFLGGGIKINKKWVFSKLCNGSSPSTQTAHLKASPEVLTTRPRKIMGGSVAKRPQAPSPNVLNTGGSNRDHYGDFVGECCGHYGSVPRSESTADIMRTRRRQDTKARQESCQ